jgi:hypothetical protein
MRWFDRSYDLKEFTLYTIPYDRSISPAFFRTPQWRELMQRPLALAWKKSHDGLASRLARQAHSH